MYSLDINNSMKQLDQWGENTFDILFWQTFTRSLEFEIFFCVSVKSVGGIGGSMINLIMSVQGAGSNRELIREESPTLLKPDGFCNFTIEKKKKKNQKFILQVA